MCDDRSSEGDEARLQQLQQQWAAAIRLQLDKEFQEQQPQRLQHHDIWRSDAGELELPSGRIRQEAQDMNTVGKMNDAENILSRNPTTFWSYGDGSSFFASGKRERNHLSSTDVLRPAIVRGNATPCVGCWNRSTEELHDSLSRRWDRGQNADPFSIIFN
ncbi:uncharacterized protein LOC108675452 [Hyalella azteca]|uniref:Uncharacterized protein LOC108675452 n=1 Tax=Hyalella azteca TaxID=294128 RepID=A0A979FJZ3_HYAAZ|nr:uncharacterized protein LOC108675452 [Hyalella azteca]